MKSTLLCLTLALALGLTQPAARASIVVVAPTSTVAGSFQITQDITFTITTAVSSGTLYFALDEWVTSDGAQNQTGYSPLLSISKNGAAAQTYGSGNMADNFASNAGAVTPNDGYFSLFSGPALAINDTVTLKAATYSLAATTGFNPQATQTFTGNMFMMNVSAVKISNTVSAAPEPGTAACLALAFPALLTTLRRRPRTA